MKITLTKREMEALYDTLLRVAEDMDDDGREGAFDATPLKGVYEKVRDAIRDAIGNANETKKNTITLTVTGR